MPKAAVSVTLDRDNIRWLEVQQHVTGARSLSQALDDVITAARRLPRAAPTVRSVVGTVEIAADDPDLTTADEMVRRLFAESLTRPVGTRRAVARQAPLPRQRRRRG